MAELETLAPVTAVLGNNDYREYGAAVDKFASVKIAGASFLVTHKPDDLAARLRGCTSALQPGDPVPHVAVHGHTHIPRVVKGKAARPATLLVCPGSVYTSTGRFSPTVAKLCSRRRGESARLVELTRD